MTCLAKNNDDLFCVEVDDPGWSHENWLTRFDVHASFSEWCENANTINGTVFIDDNCILDNDELTIGGLIVKSEPNASFGITDSLGVYKLFADSGFFQVSQMINNPFISTVCPSPSVHFVQFDSLAEHLYNKNFFNEVVDCPLLSVELNSDRRRRCFTNNTYIKYCNLGFEDANNVEVMVQLPEYINLISTDYPYTETEDGLFVFEIGVLEARGCGIIHLIDSVLCEEDITGLTQCTEAWILPNNDCLEALEENSNWDHSSVSVDGMCLNDTLVRFVILNTSTWGEGDMENLQQYRILADNELQAVSHFQLNGGESVVVDYPANGQTIRLEADQHPNHPGDSHPEVTIEACGNDNGMVSMGFVNDLAQDDADFDIEIDCMEIVDSYDPNDKRVSPEGITEQNYIKAGTVLDYQIRFQNTGTDTAYQVVVIDTLSENLDPSTLQWGLSSHAYTVHVSGIGRPVLRFEFDHINLPDSATHELASNGFVKFKVASFSTLPNGTEVNNTGHIYFDYNTAIVTNTSRLMISDTALVNSEILTIDLIKPSECKIFPNPTTGKISIETDTFEYVEVYNVSGILIQRSNRKIIDLSSFDNGIYFVKVMAKQGVSTNKIVLEK